MKVAIVTSGFFPVVDGVTVTVFQRVQRLSQLGHQVLILCPDYRAIAATYPNWSQYVGEILPGVTVQPLPSGPFMGLDFEQNLTPKAYPVLLQALADFQPDLIHVDEPERLQLGLGKIPAIDFAQKQQIPCVSFLHTNLIEYLEDFLPLPRFVIAVMQAISRRIVARIYNAYDLTLISSQTTYQKAVKMGIRNAQSAELLGIDLTQFDPTLKRADFFERVYQIPTQATDAKVKLTFLGRLTPDKGWQFTLNALTQMARHPAYQNLWQSVVLIIAGEGSMRTEIEQALAALPIAGYFLGRIDPAAVPALLINSDVHVTASEKETRGLTILEAFAAGIPVLAPRAGGIPDTVQSGQTGLLFQPQNWQDFATQLQELVSRPDLRHQLGAAARQQAEQYDASAAIDRLIQCWQQQIDRKSRRPANPKRW